jgi:hypothetical protein
VEILHGWGGSSDTTPRYSHTFLGTVGEVGNVLRSSLATGGHDRINVVRVVRLSAVVAMSFLHSTNRMNSMNVLCVIVPKQHGTARMPIRRAVRAIGVL